jgi:hypothetical protein
LVDGWAAKHQLHSCAAVQGILDEEGEHVYYFDAIKVTEVVTSISLLVLTPESPCHWGTASIPRIHHHKHVNSPFFTLRRHLVRLSVMDSHLDDDLTQVTQLGMAEFGQLLKRTRADRKKGKKSDWNRSKRVKMHRVWGRSVKRVHRYLGFRGKAAEEMAAKLANVVKS